MNNTIEALEEIKKYYAQDIIRGTETGSKRFKAIEKAISNEKVLEIAGDMLPSYESGGRADEDIPDDKEHAYSLGYGDGQIDYKHKAEPVLAKQILKVKGLEKSISDVLTQRDMWKTDYAELQAENKKLKEQQLTEDAIAEIVLQTNKDWDNYEGFDNFELFIAKAIIKARSDKKKHTCGICGEYVDHEENDCPERINI